MQAVVGERVGGPDVLELQERPTPRPGPGEVLVDVAAAGVNYIDTYQRAGQYPMPTPFVVGSEAAGAVTAVGTGVRDIAVGDHVSGQPGLIVQQAGATVA